MPTRIWPLFFCVRQRAAYGMRISDWSSDVCSSDLLAAARRLNVATELLDTAALRQRFSCFDFPRGSEGVWEARNAGHINPRRQIGRASCRARVRQYV